MKAVISIDMGTSGLRTAVYDSQLRILCSAKAEYPLIVHSEKYIEQDPELWWSKVQETIRHVILTCPIPTSDIKAISISSQSIAFVPIDKDGTVLHNAISWLDGRGEEQVTGLKEQYGEEELYRRTGKRLSPVYTLSKLLWFKEHLGEIYEQTWKILFPLDFIQYRLTGKCVCDHTIAGGSMFYQIEKQCWDTELLEENGLSKEKLSDVLWAGQVIDTIKPDIARELGLGNDVLIVNGAQDQKCAALGAGATQAIATVSLGTGCCISQISHQPFWDPSMRIPFFSYIYENSWDLEGVISTAGSAYSWFQSEFGGGKTFEELNREASLVEVPNSVMFYPYLSEGTSPHWSQGAGVFSGLTLQSKRGHLVRAVFEGIAYHIRDNLEAMAEVCGAAKELRVFGGGSKSNTWCQIIADITNTNVVRLLSSDTALAGAAMLAFMPLGCTTPDSLPKAQVFIPNAQAVSQYEKAWHQYEKNRIKIFTE